MRKLILWLSILVLVSSFGLAIKYGSPAADNGLGSGLSDTGQLYFYQYRDLWSKGDGWAKMTFDSSSIVLNGHQLEKGLGYTLYAWVYKSCINGEEECSCAFPNQDGFCKMFYYVPLGSGVVNNGGELHMSGSYGDLNAVLCALNLRPTDDPDPNKILFGYQPLFGCD
jgi:hypothetical protein